MNNIASSSELDEADDEVDREFDVYLSKSLCGKLFLLQYPIMKSKRKFGQRDRLTAKIKPRNKKLEMDVFLDTSSPSYNQSKGEQIALNVDGNDAVSHGSSVVFDSNIMDKQTLQSTVVSSAGKRYVCGIFHNGDLHLTPVSNIMQMRPSFKYMDQAEHRAVKAAKAKEAAEGESSQDEAEEAKAVTLRVKGAETEGARLARERSYAAYEKRLAEEKWKLLNVKFGDDNTVERDKLKLLCQKMNTQDNEMDRVIPKVIRTPKEYLDCLKPEYSKHAVDDSAMPNNILSVSLLKNESLGDQIKLIMKNAKIIKYDHLSSLLHGTPDPQTVVRSLQSYAVLVKGCWIVKSEVLFPSGTVSPISGTPAENLCKSRDYILFMFTVKDFLARKEVTNAVKIPSDDVKAMLSDIAVMRPGEGWKLRFHPDSDFSKRFPEVHERQAMLWNALGSKLSKHMNLANLPTESSNPKSGKIESSRKKKSSVSTDEKTVKPSKSSVKKHGKTSGAKASPVHIKTEPLSPTRFTAMPTTSPTNGSAAVSRTVMNSNSSPAIAAVLSQLSGPLHGDGISNLNSFTSQINIDNVNTTVQSIAEEIQKISSPERTQTYEMPVSNLGNVSVKRENDVVMSTVSNISVKLENDSENDKMDVS